MDSGKQMCLLCLTKESKEIERKLESVFENNNNGMVLEALNELFGLKVRINTSKVKSNQVLTIFVCFTDNEIRSSYRNMFGVQSKSSTVIHFYT